MAINLTGGLPPEILGQQQQLNRQQQMAQMLMQQGTQQPQGQMVSGRYVQPSIFAQLAPLAQMYAGQTIAERGDKKALDLAAQLRTRYGDELEQFRKIQQGTPAVEGGIYGADNKLTMQTTPDMFGADMELNPQYRKVAPVAGVAPNPQGAYDFAARAYNPALQAIGIKNLVPEEITMPEGAVRLARNPDGTYKQVATGGEKMSPDVRTAAQMLGIRVPMTEWTPQQTQAVAAQVSLNKRPPVTNVNVNTANKFAGGFADKASEGAYNLYTSAMGAPQAIENSRRTIELVNSGALTGPTANVALQAAKLFNVGGADNQEVIRNTEMLVANRGKALLGSIKASGLAGSQGLTEGERKFLTQAEGGTITLDGETLKAMAGLEIKMAVNNQKRWNQQASRMDPEILKVTGAGPVEVYTGIGSIDLSNPLLKK
jgi:hypothetical protein